METATAEMEIAADITKVADVQNVCDKSDQDSDCIDTKTDDTSQNECLQDNAEDDVKSSCKAEREIDPDESQPEMIASDIEHSKDCEDTSTTIGNEEKVTTNDDVEARKELCKSDVGDVAEGPSECHAMTEPPHNEEKDCNPPQQSSADIPAINRAQSLSFNADEDSSGIVRISDEDLKDVNGKSSGDSKKGGSEGSASDDWETEFDLELENVEVIDSVEVTEGVDVSKAF